MLWLMKSVIQENIFTKNFHQPPQNVFNCCLTDCVLKTGCIAFQCRL